MLKTCDGNKTTASLNVRQCVRTTGRAHGKQMAQDPGITGKPSRMTGSTFQPYSRNSTSSPNLPFRFRFLFFSQPKSDEPADVLISTLFPFSEHHSYLSDYLFDNQVFSKILILNTSKMYFRSSQNISFLKSSQ